MLLPAGIRKELNMVHGRYASTTNAPTSWAREKMLAWTVAAVCMIATGVALVYGSSPVHAQRKVIRLDAIKVEGRIQTPQAFYILQRSNLNFEGLELNQSFIPKIIQSVDEKPF